MIFIIILCVVGLVVHFVIGHIAAIKMTPKIAKLCTYTVYEPTEYRWESNKGREVWLKNGWKKESTIHEEWLKTNESRGEYKTRFEEQAFINNLNLIRWLWFIYLPVINIRIGDDAVLEYLNTERLELERKNLNMR